MTKEEQDKARIEGFKAAIAVVGRMARERGGDDYYTAAAWLGEQGRARWPEMFDKVEPL